MQEARKYFGPISDASAEYAIPPSLICAIGSRESNWGQGSDMRPKGPAGTGDWAPRNPDKWKYAMPPDGLGWGRGLMQVDYAQSDFGKTEKWKDPRDNFLFGAKELADNITHYKSHPTTGVDPLAAAVAAYNCGQGNVNKAIKNGVDIDSYTTGHDYSRDVLSRAAWFKSHGFDDPPLVG
jgi:Transglycosylase SLT domain